MKEILDVILYDPWPWWVGGPLIGLFAITLVLIEDKQLGISSSYQFLCAKLLPWKNEYLNQNLKSISWQFFFVAGMISGGFFLSILLVDSISVNISPAAESKLRETGLTDFSGIVPPELYGFSLKNVLILLLGGVAIGFGSRYANGCTAGHAITGCALLAPSSLIATSCFFVGGIAATYLILPYLSL